MKMELRTEQRIEMKMNQMREMTKMMEATVVEREPQVEIMGEN